jgi:sialate O-acetylesterase
MDYLKEHNKENKERGVLTGDRVHLNGAGNTLVADMMLAALKVSKPKIHLPGAISSHMVFQRDKPIKIWGKTEKGATLNVSFGNEKASTTAGEDGSWVVTLKPRPANATGTDLVIESGGEKQVVKDVLIGDVWVGSGQSNMEWRLTATMHGKESIPKADKPLLRLLHVPKVQTGAPAADVNAQWKTCTPQSIPTFSAVLYHFGDKLQGELSVPIGLINSSWGGSPIEPWTVTGDSSGKMYNGMIAPLRNLAVKGVIWYQGETNVIRKNGLSYFDKKKALIEGWRGFWGADMPFDFVQIAPWSGPKYEAGQLPALWEAQVKTLSLPHTGMAVTTDLVDKISDIHPRNKLEVGNRLARWALAKNYGKKDLVYTGPLFKSATFDGDKARVTFAHAKGLKSRDGKPMTEFQVAGEDGKFVAAKAVIDGESVVVSAEGVTPKVVRFGWHKTANPNLVNGAGLPASPFQSNDWQGATGE